MNKDSLKSKIGNPYNLYTSYKDSFKTSNLMNAKKDFKIEVMEPKVVPPNKIGQEKFEQVKGPFKPSEVKRYNGELASNYQKGKDLTKERDF